MCFREPRRYLNGSNGVAWGKRSHRHHHVAMKTTRRMTRQLCVVHRHIAPFLDIPNLKPACIKHPQMKMSSPEQTPQSHLAKSPLGRKHYSQTHHYGTRGTREHRD